MVKKPTVLFVAAMVVSLAICGCALQGASGTWSQSNALSTKQLTISSDESEWELELHGLTIGTLSGSLEKNSSGEYLFLFR